MRTSVVVLLGLALGGCSSRVSDLSEVTDPELPTGAFPDPATGAMSAPPAGAEGPTMMAMAPDVVITSIPIDSSVPSCGGALPPGDARPGETPVGWASVGDLGLSTTTGGALGETVLATTLADLMEFGARPVPLTIQVCGLLERDPEASSLTAPLVAVASDKTIVGVGTRPTVRAGFDLFEVSNVIIRNLYVEGASPDGIASRRSHHLWIDHVDISDSADGNLDISNGSDYVTVSFSRFRYSDGSREHRFSNLIGSSDNAPADVGKLRVTLHHNWWGDHVAERMPRARYGDVHVFNNYYTSVGSNYCIRAGTESRLLVEGNYFDRVGVPIELEGGSALERNNVFSSTALPVVDGVAFEPPYNYALEPAASVPATVASSAGPESAP